jgi:hypothetical protein
MTFDRQPGPGLLQANRGGGGFNFLAVFLFILYSRVFDVLLSGYKIPSIVLATTCLVALAGGQVLRSFQLRTTKLWVAFALWLTLSSFFSIWRSGSILMLVNSWSRALVVYFLIVSLALNINQCARAVRTIGWAVGVLCVMSLIVGTAESGRVFLGQGRFDNPNDLAQVLLIGAPFLWMIFARSSSIWPRLLTLPILVILTVTFVRTGSRGGMVAVLAMLIFFLITSASKGKAVFTVAALFILAAGTLAISEPLRTRYLTLFDRDADEDLSAQSSRISVVAAASAISRRELLMESLRLTAGHPLLGVGPDMFSEARERRARDEHRFAVHLQTHNTYTQVSSECGIPAALLYIWIVVGAFRIANRLYTQCKDRTEPNMQIAAAVARALCFSLLAYAFTALFISVAYQELLPILTGLTVALECAVRMELSRRATASARGIARGPGLGVPSPILAPAHITQPSPLRKHGFRQLDF